MLPERFAVSLISLGIVAWASAFGLLIFTIRMIARFVSANERLARAAEQIAAPQTIPTAWPADPGNR